MQVRNQAGVFGRPASAGISDTVQGEVSILLEMNKKNNESLVAICIKNDEFALKMMNFVFNVLTLIQTVRTSTVRSSGCSWRRCTEVQLFRSSYRPLSCRMIWC